MRAALCFLVLAGCLSQPPEPFGKRRDWHPLSDKSPGPMFGARMTYDEQRSTVMLYTGIDRETGEIAGAVYELRSNQWTRVCTEGNGPPPALLPGFAYEPVTKRLVLAGGSRTADYKMLTDEVWACTFDVDPRGTWQQLGSLHQARVGAQLVYDASLAQLILVGGRDQQPLVKPTELSSDGTTWAMGQEVGAAFMAGAGTMATYDDLSSRIVALGGILPDAGNISLFDEVWMMDGNQNWEEVCNGCGRVATGDSSIIHVPHTGETYVLNGEHVNGYAAGTWLLDQGRLVEVLEELPARSGVAVAYEAAGDRVIAYGGKSSSCTGDAMGDCDDTFELTVTP